MGREAVCGATWRRRRSEGKALLESESVVFRGDVRVELAFSTITRVEAARGRLSLVSPDGTLILELGDDAERWAARIRNPPTLADKLGLTADADVALMGVDDPSIVAVVRSRARSVAVDHLGHGRSVVIAGMNRADDLRRFRALRDAIAPDGAVWTIRPKGVADVSEVAVRAAAHAAGLVDVKVARVSATHTAEKFVIPRARRG